MSCKACAMKDELAAMLPENLTNGEILCLMHFIALCYWCSEEPLFFLETMADLTHTLIEDAEEIQEKTRKESMQ